MRSTLCALRLLAFACFLLPFALCLFPSFVFAAKITLAWDRNTENDIAGYRLYYGTTSGNYTQIIDAGNTIQHTITGLKSDVTYYFAATAYDIYGNESSFSNQVVHTIPVITHTITASAGDNGSITPSGSVTVNDGTNRNFSIHPDPMYQIFNVKVDGVSVGTVSSYSFREITGDHTITAVFAYVGPAADTDSDNDGMPDDWEIKHGLDPLKDDALLDLDEDGITNLDEFLGGTAPDTFQENSRPDPPNLLFPSDNAIAPLSLILQTENFSDPDGADFHAASQWQIVRTNDLVFVFDKTSNQALTSLNVPKLLLDEDTAYQWRVRFIDSHGLASEWSQIGAFTTEINPADTNGNGIPDHQEVDAALDLDEDGTPDSYQSDIKCVEIQGETAQIGISIRGADTIQLIQALESENLAEFQPHTNSIDQPANLPYGLIGFKLIVDEPGGEVEVTLHLSVAAPENSTWYKYDPVEDIWYDYSMYTEFSADRKRVYLTLVDGGFGDADGIANGIIVDPLALGASSSPAVVTDADASGGSGGGCFISASSNRINLTGPFGIRQKTAALKLVLALLLVIFVYYSILGTLGNIEYLFSYFYGKNSLRSNLSDNLIFFYLYDIISKQKKFPIWYIFCLLKISKPALNNHSNNSGSGRFENAGRKMNNQPANKPRD